MNATSMGQSLARLLNAEGIVAKFKDDEPGCDPEIELSKDLHIQVAPYNPEGAYSLNKCHYKKGNLDSIEYVYTTNSQLEILKYLKTLLNADNKSKQARIRS